MTDPETPKVSTWSRPGQLYPVPPFLMTHHTQTPIKLFNGIILDILVKNDNEVVFPENPWTFIFLSSTQLRQNHNLNINKISSLKGKVIKGTQNLYVYVVDNVIMK